MADVSIQIREFNRIITNKISRMGLLLNGLREMFLVRVPRLFLVYFEKLRWLNWGYSVFFVAPIYYLFTSIKRIKPGLLFLSLVIISTYPLIFYMEIISQRYFLFTYIFTVMLFIKLFFNYDWGRVMVLGYTLAVLLFSVYLLRLTPGDYCVPKLLKELKAENVTIKNDDLLITSLPRHAYYFLNHPVYTRDLDLGNWNNSSSVYFVGTDKEAQGYQKKQSTSLGTALELETIKTENLKGEDCVFGRLKPTDL